MNKRGPYQPPRDERFAARTRPGPIPEHVPELGPCLLWSGTLLRRRGGYGNFYDDDGKLKRAHRVSWELHTGVVLTPAEHVLHRCDVPACVRFEHLRLGDQAANMADMTQKGRRVHNVNRGEAQHLAKLTDAEVVEARRRFANGEEIRDIAASSASPAALKSAIYGTTWQHLPMPSYENRARQVGQSAPSCPQGHAFTEANTGHTVDKKGHRGRYCKQCNRDRARENARKRRLRHQSGAPGSSMVVESTSS